MLVVIAMLIIAKKVAQLLCKCLRALLIAKFFAKALKSLRKGIAVYIAVAKGFWATSVSSSNVKLAVSEAKGLRT